MVKHCGVRRSSLLWSVSYNVNPIAAATVAVDNTENVAAMQQGNKYSRINRPQVKLIQHWKLENC